MNQWILVIMHFILQPAIIMFFLGFVLEPIYWTLRMYCYKSYLTPVFKSLTSTMYIAAYTLTSNNCNDLMIQLLFKVFKQIHTEVSNKDSMWLCYVNIECHLRNK